MSKLKRKKSTTEETKLEQFRIKDHNESLRSHDDVLRSGKRTDSGHWWTASDLTEPEILWARALQALCTTFCDPTAACCVPELPQPLTKTQTLEQIKRPWCSLDEETSVLPEALAPFPLASSPCTFPSLPPLAPSPGLDDPRHPSCSPLPIAALGDVGGCVPIHSTAHLSLTQRDHQSEPSSDEQPDTMETKQQSAAPPLHHLSEANQRKYLSPWKQLERPGSSSEVSEGSEYRLDGNKTIVAGGSSRNSGKSRGLEWAMKIKPHVQTSGSHNNGGARSGHCQAGKEDGKESGKLFKSRIGESELEHECAPRTGLSDIRTGSTISGVSRMECKRGVGSGLGVGSGGSGIDTDTMAGMSGGESRTGIAEARLECCPMCLMPFPKGFSQMECDGHLAQCLSEMNADMVW